MATRQGGFNDGDRKRNGRPDERRYGATARHRAFRLDRPLPAAPAEEAATERVAVFGSLVTADGDIVGLVAYSIHKQNEHDWLQAFTKANGRTDAAEIAAFSSANRHRGGLRPIAISPLRRSPARGRKCQPGIMAKPSPPSQFTAARYAPRRQRAGWPGGTIAAYIALAVVVVVAVLLAARYGLPGIGGHREKPVADCAQNSDNCPPIGTGGVKKSVRNFRRVFL